MFVCCVVSFVVLLREVSHAQARGATTRLVREKIKLHGPKWSRASRNSSPKNGAPHTVANYTTDVPSAMFSCSFHSLLLLYPLCSLHSDSSFHNNTPSRPSCCPALLFSLPLCWYSVPVLCPPARRFSLPPFGSPLPLPLPRVVVGVEENADLMD